MMNVSVASVIEAVSDLRQDQVALVQGDRRRSWREMDDRAARLAHWFQEQGVSQGALVGVAARNSIEHVETLLALAKIRAIPFNINYRYGAGEVDELLEQVSAVGIVIDADLLTPPLRAALDAREISVRLAFGPERTTSGFESYRTAVEAYEPLARIERGSDGWIVFTGGTTGVPRPVRFTHQRFLGRAVREHAPAASGFEGEAFIERLIELALPRTEGHVVYVAPPLIHATGLVSALTALVVGAAVVLPSERSFEPSEVVDAVGRFRVAELVLVGDAFARPLVMELEARRSRGERPYLTSLKEVVSVGAAWSADVKTRLLDFTDARLVDMVSSSEGGPFVRGVTERTEGRVTSRFELAERARLLDDELRDVQPGSGVIGTLAAPAREDVGYLGADSSDTYTVVDGVRYCMPGDRATLEADGQVRLLGRGARVINTGGEKVHAEEVEAVLTEHPRIEGAIVIGLPHPRWGQTVAAVIAVPEGQPLSLKQVQEHVDLRLAGYKKPRVVHVVDALRMSNAGKPDLAWAGKILTPLVDTQEAAL